ncbi:MAG TPA: DnaJ domain-containing protein [Aggregatilineales bacterium]|nr:DnaJ domain-containing protein [Aggregatilineales bacterium]
MAKDYYKILGIPRSATNGDIQKAFRRLSKQFHPDLNRQAEAEARKRFQEINEAYQVLRDPARRLLHDLDLRQAASEKRHRNARETANKKNDLRRKMDATHEVDQRRREEESEHARMRAYEKLRDEMRQRMERDYDARMPGQAQNDKQTYSEWRERMQRLDAEEADPTAPRTRFEAIVNYIRDFVKYVVSG